MVMNLLIPIISLLVLAIKGVRLFLMIQILVIPFIWILLPYLPFYEISSNLLERNMLRVFECFIFAGVAILGQRIYLRALKHRSRAFDVEELGKVF